MHEPLLVLHSPSHVSAIITDLCHTLRVCIRLYEIYSPTGVGMPFRHPDIVDLFVAGVELVAGGCNNSVTYGGAQNVLICEICLL